MSSSTPALEAHGLTKSYGRVQALVDVSLRLWRGEVVGLLGDNGAGKSTFVRCISGIVRPDSGRISVDGRPVSLSSPQAARAEGIETVFQNLALVSTLSVADNVFLNREIVSGNPLLRRIGWLDDDAMHAESRRVLEALGIRLPSLETPVGRLSGGQRQAIAVGRAVAWGRHIVLLDEPAAALGVEQSQMVLELVRRLREQGVAVLMISHNLQHVMEVCDRVVVFRLGRKVGEATIGEISAGELVGMITGAGEVAL